MTAKLNLPAAIILAKGSLLRMKKVDFLLQLDLLVGLLASLTALFFRNYLTDFWIGFFEGIALTLLIFWLIAKVILLLRKYDKAHRNST